MKKETKIAIAITFAILVLLSVVFNFMLFNKTHELDQKIANLKKEVETLSSDLEALYYPEESDNTYDTSDFKEISAKDIVNESKNQLIVVMIGRQGCGYCAIYAPLLNEVAKDYNIQIRYINFLNLVDIYTGDPNNQEEYDIIKNLDAVEEFKGFGEAASLEGTPTTLFIENNKIIYGINGYVPKTTIENVFKTVGLKK